MTRVLILENDPEVISWEKDFLEETGLQTEFVKDSRSLLKMMESATIHAFIIHMEVLGSKSFSLCRRIRGKTDSVMICIADENNESDMVRALASGADDFLIHPNGLVLRAHLKALLSMYERLISRSIVTGGTEKGIISGDLVIHPKARQVTIGNRPVSLTSKEFDLLYFLIQHPDEVFSKEQLFQQIWNLPPIGDSATVTVHINRLREKLTKAAGTAYRNIETVWGAGYRFHIH